MIEVKGACIVDGTKLSAKGYNQQYRKYWKRKHGPVPEGLQIDHVCRNKSCINLEHMELVTLKENLRNRSLAQFCALKRRLS